MVSSKLSINTVYRAGSMRPVDTNHYLTNNHNPNNYDTGYHSAPNHSTDDRG